MIYTYKCTKCQKTIDYVGSMLEDQPEYIKCECGSNMVYDWQQFSKNTIYIPEKHKA